MMDRRRICRLWDRGDASALVTLVRVEGSSYRRVGARLLIASNGDYAGSVSGGCLEAEVIRKAQWMVRSGRAVVERYSTLFDDTAEIPYGLGCGGTVDLLIEPAQTPECIALIGAVQASLRGEQRRVMRKQPVKLGFQYGFVCEVAHTDGAAAHFIFISRADTAPCRADFIIAAL